MKLFLLLICFLNLFLNVQLIRFWSITVYKDANFNGVSTNINGAISQCVNLDKKEMCIYKNDYPSVYGCTNVNDEISSVNTHGNCVRLYEDINCNSPYVELKPGSRSHNDLSSFNHNDMTSSISGCLYLRDDELCEESISIKSIYRNGPGNTEYLFFVTVFRLLGNGLLDRFENAVDESIRNGNGGFIQWSSVMPDVVTGHGRAGYEEALQATFFKIAEKEGSGYFGRFYCSDLQRIKNLANRVCEVRQRQMDQDKNGFKERNPKCYNYHKTVMEMWKSDTNYLIDLYHRYC